MTALDHLGTACLVAAAFVFLAWWVFGAELSAWLAGVRNRRHIARCCKFREAAAPMPARDIVAERWLSGDRSPLDATEKTEGRVWN